MPIRKEKIQMTKKLLPPLLTALSVLLLGCHEIETEANTETETITETEIITETETETETEKETEKPISLPTSRKLQFKNNKSGIYNYCPSVMQMPDGTLYAYYCTNQTSYKIIDYIGFRRGTRDAKNNIVWEEESIVLSPTPDSWDAHHTCDPSVIAGEFQYDGESYNYLMAYLGCTSYDSQDNKIGLAVAKSPAGPFVKVGTAPLIDFTMDPRVTTFQWGVGQPSLISVDKKGHVYLFYTRGDKDGTRLMVDEWELSNLNDPQKIKTETVSTSGLYNLNGNRDFMNNADLVYDTENNVFYASSDCHPNPSDAPNYISSHFRVSYFRKENDFSNMKWRTVLTVSKENTGFDRNHNTGILRDEYGHFPPNGYITVFYTISVTGGDSLWSYKIYNYNIRLPQLR